MSRKELPLPPEHIRPFDLETFVKEAAQLNQRTLEAFTTPFPKTPDRWLSHDHFRPRPIEFTAEGEVEGGLSWLIGATIDLSFTRALFAPAYSKEGGHCYDPASSFLLELACRVDGYPDYARFCADLRQQDKGRRYRELAGLHEAMPGEDDLSHFRRRVGAEAIEVELADASYDAVENYHGIRGRGGLPVIAYNPRREDLSPEALLARGYDTNGTPYAPCGRLCHSNGYDYQADSRQYVCGRPCPLPERAQCPHGQKVRGYTHRMSFVEYPRLIGPIQRGSEASNILYAARTASERTNSYDQEVIDNGRPPKLRGLQAFRFAGAIRTVAHLLRRAITFILDVTYTLGKLRPATT